MTWQPIKSAPKDNHPILCFHDIGVCVASYYNNGWYRVERTSNDFVKPTHWMPLPDPPFRESEFEIEKSALRIEEIKRKCESIRLRNNV